MESESVKMCEQKLPKDCKVRCTENYDLFKVMDKNRDIDHVKKIIKSIKKVGYVAVPIIVNERMEIIDGQNRCEACRELGLPIYYIVIAGLDIIHCRSLNIGQSNWKMKDYIKSYSVEDISYKYLSNLISQFPEFTPRVIAVASGSFGVTGGGHTRSINEGHYHCTEKEYEKAIRILSWLRSVKKFVDKVPGKIELLQLALIFAWNNVPEGDLNKSTLTYQVKNYLNRRDKVMDGIVNMEGAIVAVDDVYNYNLRSNNRFDIVSAYRSAIRSAKE